MAKYSNNATNSDNVTKGAGKQISCCVDFKFALWLQADTSRQPQHAARPHANTVYIYVEDTVIVYTPKYSPTNSHLTFIARGLKKSMQKRSENKIENDNWYQ